MTSVNAVLLRKHQYLMPTRWYEIPSQMTQAQTRRPSILGAQKNWGAEAPALWGDGDGLGRGVLPAAILISLEPIVERLQTHPQDLGGARLVAAGELDRSLDQLAFDVVERNAQLDLENRIAAPATLQLRRQIGDSN